MSESASGSAPVDDPSDRTSPLPYEVPPSVGWTDRSRWPWYLLVLAVLLLILVSCELNRTAEENSGPTPTVTVTVTAPAASTDATTTPGRTAGRPTATQGTYKRPARLSDDELFYRTTFTSCATLNIVYRHGVGTDGAVDQVADDQTRVDDWTTDPSSYWVNEALDEDLDGVACEQGDR